MPSGQSVRLVPQVVWQVPFVQILPASQATPQSPQLAASFLMSRQDWLPGAPQSLWVVALQVGVQRPLWHEVPAAQTLPQAPQLRLSWAVGVQKVGELVGHAVEPEGQPSAQAPPRQRSPAPQTWP